jgi:hypothetical protein
MRLAKPSFHQDGDRRGFICSYMFTRLFRILIVGRNPARRKARMESVTIDPETEPSRQVYHRLPSLLCRRQPCRHPGSQLASLSEPAASRPGPSVTEARFPQPCVLLNKLGAAFVSSLLRFLLLQHYPQNRIPRPNKYNLDLDNIMANLLYE